MTYYVWCNLVKEKMKCDSYLPFINKKMRLTYIALYIGKSDKNSLDTHDLICTKCEDVENVLSYDN